MLLLGACVHERPPCLPLESAPIWGDSESQEYSIQQVIAWFTEWVDTSAVCLERIEIVADIPGEDVARYTGDRTIVLEAAQVSGSTWWGDGYTLFLGSLCHAWDWQTGYLSGEDERWSGERSSEGADARRARFARHCALGPHNARWVEAWGAACGLTEPVAFAAMLAAEVYLPLAAPWVGPPVPTAFSHTDPGPGPGWRLAGAVALDDDTGRLDYEPVEGGRSVTRYVDLQTGAPISEPTRVGLDHTLVTEVGDPDGADWWWFAGGGTTTLHPALPPTAQVRLRVPDLGDPQLHVLFEEPLARPVEGSCVTGPAYRWATRSGIWLFVDLAPGARWWHIAAP